MRGSRAEAQGLAPGSRGVLAGGVARAWRDEILGGLKSGSTNRSSLCQVKHLRLNLVDPFFPPLCSWPRALLEILLLTVSMLWIGDGDSEQYAILNR